MSNSIQNFDVAEHQPKIKNEKSTKSLIAIVIALVLTIVAWVLPPTFFGMPNLTIIEQRVIAIFVFAFVMWITEGIPSWATSVLVIVLLLLTVSNSSLWFTRTGNELREFGQPLKYQDLLATFADPIIMLFIGGFILAIGASKTGLDVSLARFMLKLFGTKSETVLLGFIMVTAFFSMFLSNTATAAMMISFMAPVLRSMPPDGKGKIGLALSIPVGANIGGIGTPIGTPPNAIALKYLNDPEGLNMNIGFGEWMSVMFPFILVLLFISWFILKTMFPFKQKNIELKIEGNMKKGYQTIVVTITFILTMLLWMTDKLTGVNANVVAMVPIAIFCATGVIKREDLSQINWSVLWMVSGGFALGLALNGTGLAKHIVYAIPFVSWSPLVVLIAAGLICWGLSNFISHTATAALLVPILAAVGVGMGDSLLPLGGVRTLLICVAVSSSVAMLLPISTPPNAIAHSTGLIEQKDMLKVGVLVGVIGLTLGYTLLIILGHAGIF